MCHGSSGWALSGMAMKDSASISYVADCSNGIMALCVSMGLMSCLTDLTDFGAESSRRHLW